MPDPGRFYCGALLLPKHEPKTARKKRAIAHIHMASFHLLIVRAHEISLKFLELKDMQRLFDTTSKYACAPGDRMSELLWEPGLRSTQKSRHCTGLDLGISYLDWDDVLYLWNLSTHCHWLCVFLCIQITFLATTSCVCKILWVREL